MKITYDEINRDSKLIVEEMAYSNKTVPSILNPVKRLALPFSVYAAFSLLSFFIFDQGREGDNLIWLGFMGFGLLHWFFLFAFVSAYESIFQMVDEDTIRELKLVKLLRRKVRAYGVVWVFAILLFGALSLTTTLNIAALVIGNFVLSIFLIFIFNIDVGRYQISGLFGALGAVKESLK